LYLSLEYPSPFGSNYSSLFDFRVINPHNVRYLLVRDPVLASKYISRLTDRGHVIFFRGEYIPVVSVSYFLDCTVPHCTELQARAVENRPGSPIRSNSGGYFVSRINLGEHARSPFDDSGASSPINRHCPYLSLSLCHISHIGFSYYRPIPRLCIAIDVMLATRNGNDLLAARRSA